jgi:glycosyltransferase involved in cell wall biosynthesis
MKLLIAISSRYYCTPDGKVWTKTSYDHEMWEEYQIAFTELIVFARVITVFTPPEGSRLANGPGIIFSSVPEWNSSKILGKVPHLLDIARKNVLAADAVMLHSPSIEAELIYLWARLYKKPIAIECRGEQSMSCNYWKKRGIAGISFLLSSYHRQQFIRHLSSAWGCIFVADQLRNHYARYMANGATIEVISDVRIPDIYFENTGFCSEGEHIIRIVNVGRLEAQKDQSMLLKACATLKEYGYRSWQLHFIGEGPLKNNLVQQANTLGIENKTFFHGFIPWGTKLFQLLDGMDLFALTSLSEGMPRVLIEAMARGIPCISTDVSGAGELLGYENLIPVGRPDLLARRLAEIMEETKSREALSDFCWTIVQKYRVAPLRHRKEEFLLNFRKYVQSARARNL